MTGMLAKVLKISLDAAKDQYLLYYSWLVSWLRVLVECLPSKGADAHG